MNPLSQQHSPGNQQNLALQGAGAYACPMHPEVRGARAGACPKCGMALEPAVSPGAASGDPSARNPSENGSLPIRQRRFTLGACVLLAVAAFYVWTEHRAHLMGALPYLLLLLCPAMHLFMHRGHRDHESHSAHQH